MYAIFPIVIAARVLVVVDHDVEGLGCRSRR
jgi:hypothetical protein